MKFRFPPSYAIAIFLFLIIPMLSTGQESNNGSNSETNPGNNVEQPIDDEKSNELKVLEGLLRKYMKGNTDSKSFLTVYEFLNDRINGVEPNEKPKDDAPITDPTKTTTITTTTKEPDDSKQQTTTNATSAPTSETTNATIQTNNVTNCTQTISESVEVLTEGTTPISVLDESSEDDLTIDTSTPIMPNGVKKPQQKHIYTSSFFFFFLFCAVVTVFALFFAYISRRKIKAYVYKNFASGHNGKSYQRAPTLEDAMPTFANTKD